jgi:hypothetical protein
VGTLLQCRSARRIGTLACLCSLLGLPGSVLACSCLPLKSPRAELADHSAVFEGTAIRVKPAGWGRTSDIQVQFKVARYWKGSGEQRLTVRTGRNTCGYSFAAGSRYLVYAYQAGSEQLLFTSICTRTRPMNEAAEDLAALGPATVPVRAGTGRRESEGGLPPALLWFGLLAVMAVCGWAWGALRRRRRERAAGATNRGVP